MQDLWLSVVLLAAFGVVGWVVVSVFHAGAPHGESSVRADGAAIDAGYGLDDVDTLGAPDPRR